MEHDMPARLEPRDLTEAELTGVAVHGPGDSKIGHLSGVRDIGGDRWAIIEVGGIMGIGAKPVAVLARDLEFLRGGDGGLHPVSRWSARELRRISRYRD